MAFRAPGDVAPTSDERELLLRFLQLQRDMVVSSTIGLTDEQSRWTPDGRLIALAGIVNHLTHVEWRWINGSLLDEPVSRDEAEFDVGPDRTLAELIRTYDERARLTDQVIRAADGLEEPCGGGAFDLRYVVIHLIEETAHHAGHADATRELLDDTLSGW